MKQQIDAGVPGDGMFPLMANPLEGTRERGTIVSWYAAGAGRIRADNGDSIVLYYWSVVQGFRQLAVGQRVEFSRMAFGTNRNAAGLVMRIPEDTHSD